MQNKIRLIGGDWRSRQILFDDYEGLRPTPVRVRETLFNWLQYDVIGSRCLDLYAGSGGLSFEAASRGAKFVLQVELSSQICQQLHANTVKLKAKQIKLVCSDVFRFLASTTETFDLVFIDPPFDKKLAIQTCQWLEDKGVLSDHAKIYLEVERQLPLEGIPVNWVCLKNKSAGELDYYLFQRQ
ncbi:MAG: 16S rRNA (guanine(966)-N(2))-methyltransferase RsmD [Methylococcales bacterium]|nr:16S rRNA (guanine(966)-N(2))-methyltransferase RsmD [Methylococcales bacterium]